MAKLLEEAAGIDLRMPIHEACEETIIVVFTFEASAQTDVYHYVPPLRVPPFAALELEAFDRNERIDTGFSFAAESLSKTMDGVAAGATIGSVITLAEFIVICAATFPYCAAPGIAGGAITGAVVGGVLSGVNAAAKKNLEPLDRMLKEIADRRDLQGQLHRDLLKVRAWSLVEPSKVELAAKLDRVEFILDKTSGEIATVLVASLQFSWKTKILSRRQVVEVAYVGPVTATREAWLANDGALLEENILGNLAPLVAEMDRKVEETSREAQGLLHPWAVLRDRPNRSKEQESSTVETIDGRRVKASSRGFPPGTRNPPRPLDLLIYPGNHELKVRFCPPDASPRSISKCHVVRMEFMAVAGVRYELNGRYRHGRFFEGYEIVAHR